MTWQLFISCFQAGAQDGSSDLRVWLGLVLKHLKTDQKSSKQRINKTCTASEHRNPPDIHSLLHFLTFLITPTKFSFLRPLEKSAK